MDDPTVIVMTDNAKRQYSPNVRVVPLDTKLQGQSADVFIVDARDDADLPERVDAAIAEAESRLRNPKTGVVIVLNDSEQSYRSNKWLSI